VQFGTGLLPLRKDQRTAQRRNLVNVERSVIGQRMSALTEWDVNLLSFEAQHSVKAGLSGAAEEHKFGASSRGTPPVFARVEWTR
jgi:hypothetical protein